MLDITAIIEEQNQWALDTWPKVELLWMFMIILHLARLLPIDPLVLHFICLIAKFMPTSRTVAPKVDLLDSLLQVS